MTSDLLDSSWHIVDYTLEEYSTNVARAHKLCDGDTFTVIGRFGLRRTRKYVEDLTEAWSVLVPIEIFKMVKWHRPATWFQYWVKLMFVQPNLHEE